MGGTSYLCPTPHNVLLQLLHYYSYCMNMLHHASPIDKRRARSTASKQKIAEAAEQLVLRNGRSGLTTSALVEVAKVSERTIFNHFK